MFSRILFILVLVFLIADIVIICGIFDVFELREIIYRDLWIYMVFLAIQPPVLYYLIYRSYVVPVENLKQGIARFHAGLDDEPNLPLNSWSRGMNEISIFFQKSLKILHAFKNELRAGRQLRSEVEIASEIQKQTLTQEDDLIPGLDIALGICSASEVGGDSLDVIKGQNGNYYLYVGDVTGHGVPSGFVMMMVNALISAFSLRAVNGAEILSETNHILKPRIKQNMMMTAVLLRWDSVAKKLYYTGAGHEFILVYKAKEQKVYKIKTGGVALGMMKNISKILKEQQILFERGDLILLYTDGITEARYRSEQNGMLFGIDRLTESILKLSPAIRNPENVFRQVTIDLSAFMGYRHIQYDDITLVVIGFTPENAESNILMEIPKNIDPTSITEWNWGISR